MRLSSKLDLWLDGMESQEVKKASRFPKEFLCSVRNTRTEIDRRARKTKFTLHSGGPLFLFSYSTGEVDVMDDVDPGHDRDGIRAVTTKRGDCSYKRLSCAARKGRKKKGCSFNTPFIYTRGGILFKFILQHWPNPSILLLPLFIEAPYSRKYQPITF
ncbi:hypothetical protein K504DRAFT_457821 [Pleomassaria siparia CBS 279.74]|uniref:Uncharacterized protein n=1 Tax=Pleomassaria siparia CBS 279.74 TaxID=1314801 RepID=A0A6G1KT58_9PLEO|nr:hypothetical protein K504DRAFT_457821 [Pleomassaria siparia CBS 279.74]